MAAAEGRVQAMRKLLQRGADPNSINDTYGGVINAAIESGNCEAVELLVENDVSLTSRESEVFEKLESLQEQREKDGVEGDAASDDNGRDGNGSDDNGNDDNESDTNESDNDEGEREIIWSPLAVAASRSDLTMFNFLLQKYSDKLPAEEFNAALVKAAEWGRLEAFKRLLREYRHPHQALQDSLNQSTDEGCWDVVSLMLEECKGLDCDEAFYNTCRGDEGQQKITLLEAMWEYTQGSISTETVDRALYYATDLEFADTVGLLLRFGANPNATGEE